MVSFEPSRHELVVALLSPYLGPIVVTDWDDNTLFAVDVPRQTEHTLTRSGFSQMSSAFDGTELYLLPTMAAFPDKLYVRVRT